jgi:hypothetical protein
MDPPGPLWIPLICPELTEMCTIRPHVPIDSAKSSECASHEICTFCSHVPHWRDHAGRLRFVRRAPYTAGSQRNANFFCVAAHSRRYRLIRVW